MDKGHSIPVLDHGYVKLIDYMGSDELIVESARMSTNKGFNSWEADLPMLDFLYKNDHSTPFESGELLIEVQAPIVVFREWHRHRTFTYNEASARYTKMPDLHYIPAVDRIKKQSKKNKQMSSNDGFDESFCNEFIQEIKFEQDCIYQKYEDALKDGVVREIARINTPVSRYSKMRVKGNLRNWLHFLDLRMRENAQYEIRVYANAAAEIIKSIWPKTYALYEEYTLYASKLSRAQTKIMSNLVMLLTSNMTNDLPLKSLIADSLNISDTIEIDTKFLELLQTLKISKI